MYADKDNSKKVPSKELRKENQGKREKSKDVYHACDRKN